MKTRNTLIAAAVLLLAVAVCHGRVFIRWNAGSQSSKAIEAAGGKMVYDAAVKVNGASGQASVFVFDDKIGRVVSNLGRQFGAAALKYSGGTMAVGTYRNEERVIKLVAAEFKEGAQSVVVKLEQSESEARASERAPLSAGVAGLPEYPGGAPLFSAEDENTGLAMGISETGVDEFEARAMLDSLLKADGWKSFNTGGARTGLMMYEKGSAVCCVFVSQARASGPCRITLLHKTLKSK